MKLEDQVTSLELSKKLKELGVKQESVFFWANTKFDGKDFTHEIKVGLKGSFRDFGVPDLTQIQKDADTAYSAFTVAELGEMLPKVHGTCWSAFRMGKYWYVRYETKVGNYVKRADAEANARAKMLIYLLENKLIEL